MFNVGVFCGAQSGNDPKFIEATQELGKVMADRGMTLVYGGATVGLMGILADTVLKNKGCVIGVIPQDLTGKEIMHTSLTNLKIVSSLSDRKEVMINESDIFITLPGGLGTIDEWSEALTWAQLGYHSKPMGLLNIAGYYDPLLEQLKRSVEAGFIAPTDLSLLKVANHPVEILDLVTGALAEPKAWR